MIFSHHSLFKITHLHLFLMFINQVVIPHKSLFFNFFYFLFYVFITVLFQCVVCVGFRRLVTTGTSVLGDSNDKPYLIR